MQLFLHLQLIVILTLSEAEGEKSMYFACATSKSIPKPGVPHPERA